MKMGKKEIREFENTLDYALGGISAYREGRESEFVPHGIEYIRNKLHAAKRDLEKISLYDQSLDALQRLERVKDGPEYDEDAEMSILKLSKMIGSASGTFDAIRKKLKENPAVTVEDLKSDPDKWKLDDMDSFTTDR